MLKRIRIYIESHFSLVLVVSSMAGLVLPGLPSLPNQAAVVTMALLMFFASYKLRDGGFSTLRWRGILGFCLLRYGILPIVLWALTYAIAPAYATAILLLTTVPTAVSSPALTSIYGGAVSTAFAIAILSQLATPFMVPLQFTWLTHFGLGAPGQIIPQPAHLFMTMVWCIFLPMGLYSITRHHKPSAQFIYRNDKLLAILLVAFVIALVISKQRDIIFANLPSVGISLLVAMICFSSYILFGWFYSRGRPTPERITYTTCSAFNNVALGVSLALMHFQSDVVIFVAISEMAWSLLPLMVASFLKRQKAIA